MTITKEQIKHIAGLAKLNLTENEEEKYLKEFNDILGYIELINEVEVTEEDNVHNLEKYNMSVLAEDNARPSKISKKKMLANATNGREKNGYIRVSKIIDK